VRKTNPEVNPIIIKLHNMDFWYWSQYFVDIYQNCPYRCCYCNTQKFKSLKGFSFVSSLPERKQVIGLGLICDIYSEYRAGNERARNILGLLDKNRYPVNIVTKSNMIVKDIDILKRLAKKGHIRVTFTLLTLDDFISGNLEGNAPPPSERLKVLGILRSEGIDAGIAVTPIIPGVNDDEEQLTRLVKASKDMGAGWVLFSGFNPVRSFMNNPLWKSSASLYSDKKALDMHYKHIKKFMLGLLLRENLPFRVPRITLSAFDRKYYSNIVSEYLFNISYLYELMSREMEMLRYRRAAYKINGIIESLKHKMFNKKLGSIRGINPEIEKTIEEIILREDSSFYSDLHDKIALEV
jgi:DNA repair photolyase